MTVSSTDSPRGHESCRLGAYSLNAYSLNAYSLNPTPLPAGWRLVLIGPMEVVPATPSPCLMIIFGASGDLTRRKLVPALFDMWRRKQLPERFAVLGIARTEMSDDAFRERLGGVVDPARRGEWSDFAARLFYAAADPTVGAEYGGIGKRMLELSQKFNTGSNRLIYLAVAPQLYEPIVQQLGAHEIVAEGRTRCSLDRDDPPWQRVIVEKPFGYDPVSAAELNRVIGAVVPERNAYRIDHYLGKQMVQNLLVFRFANAIFEPIWNQHYIDHVQVTAAETVGVEGRGGYYDSRSGGAMRDMIQSHLLQVMALVAMEPPVSMSADDVRNEKIKVFTATRIPGAGRTAEQAVRGQYGPGQVGGAAVPGYREEEGTAPDSPTETYAALQLHIDTWRWGGVPFYLRSGKRIGSKLTEVVVTFKHTPHCLFREEATRSLRPNQIVMNLQPNEGIRLRFEGKVPGSGMKIRDVVMDFDYAEHFHAEPPDAYATLLLDAMRGDQTLFKHREEIERAWQIVQPIIDQWAAEPPDDFPNYACATWGPSEADVMMARANRKWHNPG